MAKKLRYNEDKLIERISQYIAATYQQHYVTEEDEVQTVDFIFDVTKNTGFYHGNAIKYLARWGKKNGHNEDDLLKAIHYIILLHYFHYSKSAKTETDVEKKSKKKMKKAKKK